MGDHQLRLDLRVRGQTWGSGAVLLLLQPYKSLANYGTFSHLIVQLLAAGI